MHRSGFHGVASGKDRDMDAPASRRRRKPENRGMSLVSHGGVASGFMEGRGGCLIAAGASGLLPGQEKVNPRNFVDFPEREWYAEKEYTRSLYRVLYFDEIYLDNHIIQ